MTKASNSLVVHKVTLVPAATLNSAPYNPRRIKDREFAALKASITSNGFVEPIVVRKTGREVIGGHQRLRALKELCAEAGTALPKVPCVVLDVDARKAKMLNIALNNIGGEFDDAKLASLIESITTESAMNSAEVMAIGFRAADIERYLEAGSGAEKDGAVFAKSVTLSIAFDSVEERDACRGLLMEQAKRRSIKTGPSCANYSTRT